MDIFLKPDWSNGVRESLEFLTTIFTSDSGKEQRSAERTYARRSLSFEVLLHADALRDLRADLHERSDFLSYIPEPVHRVSTVAVYAPLGSTSIRFADVVSSDHLGKRVCIMGGKRNFFATVAGIAGSTVTFSAPIEREAVVGDDLRLCVEGRMPTSVSVNYVTDDIAYFNAGFNQNPGTPNIDYGTSAFPTFKGREVFNEKPNWTNPPSVEIVSEYDVTDFKRGVIRTYSPIDFISRVTQFTFLGRSTAKMNRLVDFFQRQLGRCGEFWCPSWTSDLRLVQPISNGTNYIVVAGRKVADYYGGSTVEKAVAIQRSNSAWLYRYITGISTDGTNSTITFDSSFTFDVDLEAIAGLYWLNVCRFATDTMTVQWITDEVAQTVFQITTLEALPAEAA